MANNIDWCASDENWFLFVVKNNQQYENAGQKNSCLLLKLIVCVYRNWVSSCGVQLPFMPRGNCTAGKSPTQCAFSHTACWASKSSISLCQPSLTTRPLVLPTLHHTCVINKSSSIINFFAYFCNNLTIDQSCRNLNMYYLVLKIVCLFDFWHCRSLGKKCFNNKNVLIYVTLHLCLVGCESEGDQWSSGGSGGTLWRRQVHHR